MLNDVEIVAGDFTLYLRCDGLDKHGAAKLAFELLFWSQWGSLPDKEEVEIRVILPPDRPINYSDLN